MSQKNAKFNEKTAQLLFRRWKSTGSPEAKSEYLEYLRGFAEVKDPNACCVLGYFYLTEGKNEEAKRLVENSSFHAQDPDALSAAGMYYWQRGDYGKAFLFLNRFFSLKDRLFSLNSRKPALEEVLVFDRCLEICNITEPGRLYEVLHPFHVDNTDAKQRTAGHALFLQGKMERNPRNKEEMLQRAVEKGCRDALWELGNLLLNEKDRVSEGIQLLEKAAEQNSPDAFLRLTDYYLEQNEHEKAASWCSRGHKSLKGILDILDDEKIWICRNEVIAHARKICTILDQRIRTNSLANLVPKIYEKTQIIHREITALNIAVAKKNHILSEEIHSLSDRIIDGIEEVLSDNWVNRETLERLIEERFIKLEEMSLQTLESLRETALKGENDEETFLRQREWERMDECLRTQTFSGIWHNFTERTRNSILTALMLMKYYAPNKGDNSLKENFNYLSMPLCTGIEMEMKENFYNRYIDYCIRTIGSFENNKQKWPRELIYFKNDQPIAVNNKFMIGSFLSEYSRSECFMKFLIEYYGCSDVDKPLQNFRESLNKLNCVVRIESAHGFVSFDEAKLCFKSILGFVRDPSEPADGEGTPLLKLLGELVSPQNYAKHSQKTASKKRKSKK